MGNTERYVSKDNSLVSTNIILYSSIGLDKGSCIANTKLYYICYNAEIL